ncbi:MAG: Transcriptional regulator, AbrB family [Clostridia bacterium 62_21]|nr:MAG: Transcriptional regulator, AbrB family [Clostridia bacterium 62_21]HAG07411.1 AbrB family transcriptional regulator [Peptococcaceae bacterium]
MYTTVVSSRGQVVIPAEARKKLNIRKGDVLSVEIEEGGRIVLKVAASKRTARGVVEKTAGLFADLELSGLEYVENIRRGSGGRLDDLEGGC